MWADLVPGTILFVSAEYPGTRFVSIGIRAYSYQFKSVKLSGDGSIDVKVFMYMHVVIVLILFEN